MAEKIKFSELKGYGMRFNTRNPNSIEEIIKEMKKWKYYAERGTFVYFSNKRRKKAKNTKNG